MNEQFLNLIHIELLKLKRTASVFVLITIPLFTCIISTLLFLGDRSIANISTTDIPLFWAGLHALWGYLILPLFIALIAALTNHLEHKNSTWRVMFSLPLTKLALFWSKFLVLMLYIFLANILLWLFANMFLMCIAIFSEQSGLFIGLGVLAKLPYLLIAIFPIALLYHVIAWRFEQIILPLAIGIIAGSGVMYIGSSEYWVYYPWSYGLIALSATDPSQSLHSVVLAGAVSLLLSACVFFSIEKLSRSE